MRLLLFKTNKLLMVEFRWEMFKLNGAHCALISDCRECFLRDYHKAFLANIEVINANITFRGYKSCKGKNKK